MWRLGAILLVTLLVAAACGGQEDDNPQSGLEQPSETEATGTSTSELSTGTGTPVATRSSGEEQSRIEAAIEQIYQLMTAGQYDEVWNSYTREFRQRCSFDSMQSLVDTLRTQGVIRLEVVAFHDIQFVGNSGQASYSVAGYDEGGAQTAQYDYDVLLVKEDGRWLLNESCF